jgi:antitoxin VapB
MNVRISDPKIDELAAELAKRTGEDPTAAVVRVLEEKLTRQPEKPVAPLDDAERERRMAEIQKIVAEFNQLPVLDNRTPEEMLYDEDGLPA